MVKVVYGLGIGTAAISKVSPLANRLLALFGEEGMALGPAQTIVLDATMRDKALVKSITDAVVQTVFATGNVAVNAPVQGALVVNEEAEIMRYERLMDCQHDSPMRTHALAFVRSCMIGGWRARDNKPFVSHATFFGMVPAPAWLWAAQRFTSVQHGPSRVFQRISQGCRQSRPSMNL